MDKYINTEVNIIFFLHLLPMVQDFGDYMIPSYSQVYVPLVSTEKHEAPVYESTWKNLFLYSAFIVVVSKAFGLRVR